jgi:hypothetical protein
LDLFFPVSGAPKMAVAGDQGPAGDASDAETE